MTELSWDETCFCCTGGTSAVLAPNPEPDDTHLSSIGMPGTEFGNVDLSRHRTLTVVHRPNGGDYGTDIRSPHYWRARRE
jgi:hypothetical protein